jgi:hypothetical protein
MARALRRANDDGKACAFVTEIKVCLVHHGMNKEPQTSTEQGRGFFALARWRFDSCVQVQSELHHNKIALATP